MIDSNGNPIQNARVKTYRHPFFSVNPVGIYPVAEEVFITSSDANGEICIKKSLTTPRFLSVSKNDLIGHIDLKGIGKSKFEITLKKKNKHPWQHLIK